ncbi:MAG: hypothetical protein J5367_03410 [Lachnospiraceae bacterium]|nr:hypothetical protein [Lachnospiraceae bacterium]
MKTILNRKSLIPVILLILLSALCACSGSEDDYAETVIVVGKKGNISEKIVESFSKDYYDIEELKAEFVQSVSDYNESIGSEEIKLKDIELKDSKVYVTVDFNGPSDYEHFVGESMFVGTVNEAYDNGYTMDVTLKGVDNGDKIGKVQIMGMIDKDIVILSEHSRVRTYRDIAYVSANVDVIGPKEARVLSESDGLAYLLLK